MRQIVPVSMARLIHGISPRWWEVADIQQSLRELVAAGAREQRPVTDVSGGKLIATVADPDGNMTGLMQTP
ncbi:MAG: VOC family protein [Streptosporangiaceae bacterium]